MSQLDVYSIHEVYLSGAVFGLCSGYVAEELESAGMENLKAYVYTHNLYKAKKVNGTSAPCMLASDITVS